MDCNDTKCIKNANTNESLKFKQIFNACVFLKLFFFIFLNSLKCFRAPVFTKNLLIYPVLAFKNYIFIYSSDLFTFFILNPREPLLIKMHFNIMP